MINKAILHILDLHSDMCVISQKELDFSSGAAGSFLEKHLERIQSDGGQRPGTFEENSEFLSLLRDYAGRGLSFVEFSNAVANKLYEQLSHTDNLESIDLVVADFISEDIPFIALLIMNSKIAYTHQVVNGEDGAHNEIIRHFSILPGGSQKIDSYALIRLDNFSVGFVDKKRQVNGEEVYLLPEAILECSATISSKEAFQVVREITNKIAEDHGANAAVAISKAKHYLMEHAETSPSFSPVELGCEVFSDSDIMQQEFQRQVAEAQLPPDIQMNHSVAVRTGRSHKIKTDTGIEITFPAEYFENHNYIEFINNPDGTISIELKNIGKITNR